MKVTLIQTKIFWEDRLKNLNHFNTLINSVSVPTDLIVLPEMFTTGFTMNPETLAEPSNGEALTWLKEKAAEKNCVITGSVSVEENSKFYNRLFWVKPDGNYQTYNKRHLFRMAKEEQHYTAGDKKIITELGDWKICPLICYDLRFPVWSRNRYKREDGKGKMEDGKTSGWDYDVLLYLANWPEVRSYPWKQLLIARAIENQCYVIGLNRIGEDGNGFTHSGDSVVINPRGEIISKINAHEEVIETVELNRAYLDEFRKVFPVGLDADDFNAI